MTRFVFAFERLDTWVFNFGIAVPVVCIAGLILWQWIARAGKTLKTPGTRRQSPEPQSPWREGRESRDLAADKSDAERLQRKCLALEQSLAQAYLDLANCCQQTGQSPQATAALRKIVERCPETPQAPVARDRLQQLASFKPHSQS